MSAATTWLTIPERHPGRVIAAIGLLFALAYASSLFLLKKPDGRIVIGDAVHYYVYLRSAVFDGDLQFRDEYVRLYGLRGGEPETEWIYQPTATGHTRNVMSIGPAIVWAPLYLLVTALTWLVHAVGGNGAAAADGYERVFQASTGLSGVLAATIGAYAAYAAAAKLFDPRAAIWSTLTMWLAGSAIYYSLVSPTYSHAASMLTVGLFIWAWIATLDRQTIARYALVGALGGLATLVRWQDAVLLVIPAIDAVWQAWEGRFSLPRTALCLIAAAVAAVAVFSPQMLVWWTLYGDPFLVPQGEDFMHWGSPALFSVLFSPWHGLLMWTPVVAASLVGLVLLVRRRPLVGVALTVAFLIAFYTNAAVADWWAGEAFGSRRFVSCFPILVIGLAALISRLQYVSLRAIAIVAAMFVIYNGLLLLQYQTYMHGLRTVAPYPGGFVDLWLMRFVVPFRLLAWWLR